MAGKVLFVDDECMSLKTEHTITNALIKIGDAEEKTNAGIYSFTSSFEDAVRGACAEAEYGNYVMLSPACASMDMFRSYKERGERFKALVCEYTAG